VGRTTVVVAHRLSTIKGADVIAVVKEVREPRGRAYLI
jgi:ABC-type transport system involved in Fe-S cluster assembly fused permease/ATPase subunit